jgi:hypothetical protein
MVDGVDMLQIERERPDATMPPWCGGRPQKRPRELPMPETDELGTCIVGTKGLSKWMDDNASTDLCKPRHSIVHIMTKGHLEAASIFRCGSEKYSVTNIEMCLLSWRLKCQNWTCIAEGNAVMQQWIEGDDNRSLFLMIFILLHVSCFPNTLWYRYIQGSYIQ